ncbi:MAG: hypothetical protein PF495_11765 [Spirochaetales bacterium]|jgi:hypothetical protein|nr:hypothetical protein [Spirochaetales bacterium]
MRTKHFNLYELVPEREYNSVPHHILWMQLDNRLLKAIDHLREKWGVMVGNTWKWGGNYQNRGWRNGWGSRFSQHYSGRAQDLEPSENSVDVVRNDIISNPQDYPFITEIELEVSWLHVGCRNLPPGFKGLYKFKP